jgi:hypothetical protein
VRFVVAEQARARGRGRALPPPNSRSSRIPRPPRPRRRPRWQSEPRSLSRARPRGPAAARPPFAVSQEFGAELTPAVRFGCLLPVEASLAGGVRDRRVHHRLAGLAEVRQFPLEADDDAIDVRDFRAAQPKYVRRTGRALFRGSDREARCGERAERRRENQAFANACHGVPLSGNHSVSKIGLAPDDYAILDAIT